MVAETREVTLGEEPNHYRVRRSREATQPRIDVGIREITVVVPQGDDADPETLLRENADWVLEKKAKFDQYRDLAPDRVFEEGETIPFEGESHELIVERRSASDIGDGVIRLAEHHVEQTSIQRALKQLYRWKAQELIETHLEQYAEEMRVEYDKLEVRNQRTKWGSCSSSGTLGINWRLIMAPPEILEYVVIHELAHLEVDNHTKAFWAIVAEYDPEYRQHAEWLEENSAQLIFSNEDL